MMKRHITMLGQSPDIQRKSHFGIELTRWWRTSVISANVENNGLEAGQRFRLGPYQLIGGGSPSRSCSSSTSGNRLLAANYS